MTIIGPVVTMKGTGIGEIAVQDVIVGKNTIIESVREMSLIGQIALIRMILRENLLRAEKRQQVRRRRITGMGCRMAGKHCAS